MEGKIALVTGASRGIGRQIVEDLISIGNVSKVCALCILKNELNQLYSDFPNHVEPHVIDLKKWTETKELIESFGPVDLVVNNAGVVELNSIGDISEKSFDRQFNVNVKAVLNVSQVVAKSMIASGIRGSIVNISSRTRQTERERKKKKFTKVD